ncbi:MAG: sigma-E processing peptidase SpoIIGA [Clostridia bacterium]|nr:sigma-E processing peptidase SpoIIGA [Clostridia bacterium]
MVWVDVYLAVNFVLDLLCLRLSALFADCRRPRCVIGALVGTVYAAGVFIDLMWPLYLLPCRAVFGTVICLCAFGRRQLVLRTLVYIALSAAFAGIFTALYPYLGAAGLMLAALGGYVLLLAALRTPSQNLKNIAASRPARVELDGKGAEFPLFYDSGCQLRDPVSGRGAMIVSALELAELLPSGPLEEILSGRDPISAIERSSGLLRPVFFTTADGREEMLAAFLPDRVTVGSEDKTGLLVALTSGLDGDGIRAIAGKI